MTFLCVRDIIEKMETENYTFRIPKVEPKKASIFAKDNIYFEIYQELNNINEEIEACRSKNS